VTDHPGFRPDGDDQATAVYDELRRIAAVSTRRDRAGLMRQATALVHEAYLRLAGTTAAFTERNHFIGIAARSMRHSNVSRRSIRSRRASSSCATSSA